MKSSFPTDQHFRQCVGIDVSKDSFTACLCMLSWGCRAECTEVQKFSNNKTGFNQLVKWARREAEKSHPVYFLMEPTATYHENLAYHLVKLSFTVYMVPGARVRYFFKEEGLRTKTDSVDARGLALMGCQKPHMKAWTPPPSQYRELRQLSRLGVQLGKIRTMLGNQKEALLSSYQPSKEVLAELSSLIESVDGKIEANLKKMNSIAADEGISKKIEYIKSIPGIGFLTAVTILAETDGFATITSRKQLASYAGLDVVAKDSGTVTSARHISKRGNGNIRRALYMCALTASIRNPQLRQFYCRIKAKRPHKVAMVAVMRKMLLLAFTLCRSEVLYDSNK